MASNVTTASRLSLEREDQHDGVLRIAIDPCRPYTGSGPSQTASDFVAPGGHFTVDKFQTHGISCAGIVRKTEASNGSNAVISLPYCQDLTHEARSNISIKQTDSSHVTADVRTDCKILHPPKPEHLHATDTTGSSKIQPTSQEPVKMFFLSSDKGPAVIPTATVTPVPRVKPNVDVGSVTAVVASVSCCNTMSNMAAHASSHMDVVSGVVETNPAVTASSVSRSIPLHPGSSVPDAQPCSKREDSGSVSHTQQNASLNSTTATSLEAAKQTLPAARSPYRIIPDDEWHSCTVHLGIPGLKKPRFGKSKHTVAVNFGNRSLDVDVSLSDTVQYKYGVDRLPGEIIPTRSTYKICNDEVRLNLKKKCAESWEAQLRRNGLETSSAGPKEAKQSG